MQEILGKLCEILEVVNVHLLHLWVDRAECQWRTVGLEVVSELFLCDLLGDILLWQKVLWCFYNDIPFQ